MNRFICIYNFMHSRSIMFCASGGYKRTGHVCFWLNGCVIIESPYHTSLLVCVMSVGDSTPCDCRFIKAMRSTE